MTELSKAQRDFLLRPLEEVRVKQSQGMSYLEGYEVTAHLNRVFGFEGWSKEITMLEQVFATQGHPTDQSKKGWYACYRSSVRLSIHFEMAPSVVKEDAGTGSAENQPSQADAHDLAIKSAVTDALKRAAKDLGDQFGLSLYRKGSTDALVRWSLPYKEQGA